MIGVRLTPKRYISYKHATTITYAYPTAIFSAQHSSISRTPNTQSHTHDVLLAHEEEGGEIGGNGYLFYYGL